jgi:hypothetical protein
VDGGDALARQPLHGLSVGAANIGVHDIHGSSPASLQEEPIVPPRPPGGVIAIHVWV